MGKRRQDKLNWLQRSLPEGLVADAAWFEKHGKVLTENVGGLIMDARTADFDRLRYLFWRYLDWRERLKVLVEADALPHTVEEPLPQTMERKALEAAASTPGKLYELWEAIMPFVPREKQDKNPFKPRPDGTHHEFHENEVKNEN